MNTALSPTGEIVLPAEVRAQLGLAPGDDFEVTVEDEDTITLRRVRQPANTGLADLLLSCPWPFEVPERAKDDSTPLSL